MVEGLIAPWVIPGAMDLLALDAWIETQHAPCLAPGTAVIFDNLSTQRSPRDAEVLKAHGCSLLSLPPYGPDLNPIDMALSKLIRQRIQARDGNTSGILAPRCKGSVHPTPTRSTMTCTEGVRSEASLAWIAVRKRSGPGRVGGDLGPG